MNKQDVVNAVQAFAAKSSLDASLQIAVTGPAALVLNGTQPFCDSVTIAVPRMFFNYVYRMIAGFTAAPATTGSTVEGYVENVVLVPADLNQMANAIVTEDSIRISI